MIQFKNLSKSFWFRGQRRVVIDNIDMTLPTGKSLALLGRNGAGKSTLLNIVSGALPPDTGRVDIDGTVSWPVGFSAGLQKQLSGAQNVRFVARTYGVDTDALMAFVLDFSELGEEFEAPVQTYSSGMKARLSFGISMGIKFDVYLVDESMSAGDVRFKFKGQAVFNHRIKAASVIMVSHSMKQLRSICDSGIVLENGRLTYFEDLDEAIALHEANLA
ncbi:MAG: ABC transporter ATP-binding protein [Rhodobacteraceae bacterium]|nr:ABC transporter ATP-binding protein [Paracoccaceae bacterium]